MIAVQWITTSRHTLSICLSWKIFIFINIYKHWFPLNSANDQIKPVFVFVSCDVNRFLRSCSCPTIMHIITALVTWRDPMLMMMCRIYALKYFQSIKNGKSTNHKSLWFTTCPIQNGQQRRRSPFPMQFTALTNYECNRGKKNTNIDCLCEKQQATLYIHYTLSAHLVYLVFFRFWNFQIWTKQSAFLLLDRNCVCSLILADIPKRVDFFVCMEIGIQCSRYLYCVVRNV